MSPRVLQQKDSPPSRALLLALISALPFLVWWLGWYPGILSSDSIDQLGQAERFEFFNFHPAFHTLYLWLLTPFWDSPGSISLFQVLALAVLLAVVASRLAALGVPWWLGGATAIGVALLPAVAPTTIAIWKDVPFGLALIWAFAELLALAQDPQSFWNGWPGPVRLGLALSLMWLFRHNGFLTVVPLLAALAVGYRHRLGRVAITAGVVAGAVIFVQGVLYSVLPVTRDSIEPSQTFTSDVAASLRWEPENFSAEELDYLDDIAPISLWVTAYDCRDSTPLAFHPEFDDAAIRSDPGPFRSIVIRTLLRDPDTVLGHRWCAASYLLVPPQPEGSYFQRPPFDIAANEAGFRRNPISDRAFSLTEEIFRWAEGPLWLTWRPALAVWLGIITYVGVALRPSLRRLLWPGALLAFQLLNVALTTPAQEFRFAYPIYIGALMSTPLLWLAWRPSRATLVAPIVDDRA